MSTATPGITEKPPATRDELLARMDAGWRPFQMKVWTLDAKAMARPTPAGWTYTQMLAHVSAWHDLTARRLRTFATSGTQEPAEDADAFNARVAREATGRTRDEILRELDRSAKDLRGAVEALTDEQVVRDTRDTPQGPAGWAVAVVAGNSYGHYEEHVDDMRAVLPSSAAELANRLDDAWAGFREEIRHLGREGLSRTTATGWTKKDLLAHVIGWIQDVPARLTSLRDGTFKPIGGQAGIDAFNAKSVADRKLVGPEAILDELDASYRLTRAAVVAMSAREVADPRTLVVVATRTYLHWEEHEPELRS
ncbi:MAG: DinB family protein [Chloroflexi bacterium]|nr:DinB family protein [Chloroflexota bacterium]